MVNVEYLDVGLNTIMVRILSVNTRGLANEKKRRTFFSYHRPNAEILIALETHSTNECERVWENEWGGKIFFAHGTNKSKGIAVCVRKEVASSISNVYKCIEGRKVIFDVMENGQKITIVAIYAPNEDSPVYFQELGKLLENRQEHKIIIGDFNLVLDIEKDRRNTYCNNNKSMKEVENLMDEFYLKDMWRIRNEERREFSWYKGSHIGMEAKASRIDIALVSGGLDQEVKEIMYISSIMTDHRAIYLVVDLKGHERGCGYWKFNVLHLKEQDFLAGMNKEIDFTLSSNVDKNPSERWEILKQRIKKYAVGYARGKTSIDRQVIANLSEKVNEYEARLPLNREEDQLWQRTKSDLEEKLLEQTAGIMFRSKVRWYELGEKNTKYFYALEKAKYNAKTCYSIISDSGNEISDPGVILEEQRKFYQQLYEQDLDVEFTMENKAKLYVPEHIRLQQESQITMAELGNALMGMNKEKTPGEDGIPPELYKVFWGKIKYVFYEMVVFSHTNKKLHGSARKGILNLIPKGDKDTRFIKNLRPITLLNSDYKIVEKAIANKIIPSLEHIIHSDQRGFMKDRRISVNIRKLLDVINIAKTQDLEAVVLSLDFVKCFDKCSFSILHGSLEYFRFGSVVQEWTKILYDDFSVKIQNNGNKN